VEEGLTIAAAPLSHSAPVFVLPVLLILLLLVYRVCVYYWLAEDKLVIFWFALPILISYEAIRTIDRIGWTFEWVPALPCVTRLWGPYLLIATGWPIINQFLITPRKIDEFQAELEARVDKARAERLQRT
jgi:hypothetical protein